MASRLKQQSHSFQAFFIPPFPHFVDPTIDLKYARHQMRSPAISLCRNIRTLLAARLPLCQRLNALWRLHPRRSLRNPTYLNPSSYRHSSRLCIEPTYTLPRLGEREVWDAEGLYGRGGYEGDGKSVEKSRNGLTEDLLESRWRRKAAKRVLDQIQG